jgi:hypothetical protein
MWTSRLLKRKKEAVHREHLCDFSMNKKFRNSFLEYVALSSPASLTGVHLSTLVACNIQKYDFNRIKAKQILFSSHQPDLNFNPRPTHTNTNNNESAVLQTM